MHVIHSHGRSIALAFALSCAIAAFIAGCHVNSEPLVGNVKPEMVLRAYDVPREQAQELRNIVSSLLWNGDGQPRGGNVVVAPTGQLLVSAPAAFHEGVKQLADAVKAMPQQSLTSVAIDYWIVRGAPGETKVGDDVPKAAAEALAQMGGGMTLSLWDHTRITSISNERSEVERKGARFEQVASVQGDQVNADVDIQTDVGRIKLRTALTLDKSTVLIQATDASAGSMANGAVFYVVRASLAQ